MDHYTKIELALAIIASAIIVFILASCFRSSPRDPLATAPDRPNNFSENSLLIAFVVYFLGASLVHEALSFVVEETDSIFVNTTVNLSTSVVGIAICLYLAHGQFHGGATRFLLGHRRPTLAMFLLWVVGVTTIALGICPLILRGTFMLILNTYPNYTPNAHRTIEFLHDPDRSSAVVMALWIGAVVLAPIAEECFFRGMLQTFLARALHSRWSAIALTAVAFGAVHFEQPHAVPALAALAILMGFAYERTGSLLIPIAIHAAFNLKTLIHDSLINGA